MVLYALLFVIPLVTFMQISAKVAQHTESGTITHQEFHEQYDPEYSQQHEEEPATHAQPESAPKPIQEEIVCNAETDAKVVTIVLEDLKNYSQTLLPNSSGVVAQVEIMINDISQVSELDSFFELDLYFSEIWMEPRLKYDDTNLSTCVGNVTLSLDFLNKIWMPNVCIVNSKAASKHSSPSENIFLILYANGKLWKNCRMLVRGPCDIHLRLFPFDVQSCSLIFESYSYNSEKVQLYWSADKPIKFVQEIELPEFVLQDYISSRKTVPYPNGEWEQLTAKFVFARRYGYYIMQAYLPTYLTIFAAWISFWMDPKELPTRATLCISAFLAICLQLGSIQQNQPRVSYVKAMDVWMLASIMFLFAALAELAVISYILRTDRIAARQARRKKHRKDFEGESCSRHCALIRDLIYANSGALVGKANRVQKAVEMDSKQTEMSDFKPHLRNASRQDLDLSNEDISDHVTEEEVDELAVALLTVYNIDKVFVIMYPPVYIFFNIVYWSYYL